VSTRGRIGTIASGPKLSASVIIPRKRLLEIKRSTSGDRAAGM
jgi:hypothetical protein